MPALITVRYTFVSRRLCKHTRAGVWVKQYTIYTCVTWEKINKQNRFLAGDATEWRDSKQVLINLLWIDLWLISPWKGIWENEEKGNILTGWVSKTLKVYCTWKLSVASGCTNLFTFIPQCLAGKSQNKNKLALRSKSWVMLVKWGCYYCALFNSYLNTSKLWIKARLDFKALIEELSISDGL